MRGKEREREEMGSEREGGEGEGGDGEREREEMGRWGVREGEGERRWE